MGAWLKLLGDRSTQGHIVLSQCQQGQLLQLLILRSSQKKIGHANPHEMLFKLTTKLKSRENWAHQPIRDLLKLTIKLKSRGNWAYLPILDATQVAN